MIDFINSIISYWGALIVENIVLLKTISIIISGLILWRIIVYIIELETIKYPIDVYWDSSGHQDKFMKRRAQKFWMQIMERLQEGSQNNLKLAIVEADHVLGEILKNAGFPGDNLDEQLQRSVAEQIKNLEDIREAHRVRNEIFRDPSFVLAEEEAKKHILAYQNLFEDFGYLG